VSQPPKTRPSGPPHNPNVRDLTDGKRQYSSPSNADDLKRGFRGWHERGYLPHRDEPGLTQFVTFRLADSFPESLRSEWEHRWMIEDNRRRRAELEKYLDRGRGECYLRQPRIAEIVEDSLRFFHPEHYSLLAWVVMPNHIHVLFKAGMTPMARVVESWKKHSAQPANRLLGRRGQFWQADYWDTFMRDGKHEARVIK
jgi:REP element-mobilizing transposase RayT